MSSNSELLTIPKLVMDHVIEYLNYVDIIHVKRTCRAFCDFVDDRNPNPDFRSMQLFQDATLAWLRLQSSKQEDSVTLEYGKTENGCVLEAKYNGTVKTRVLDGIDYTDALCRDLEPFMRHHKSVFEIVVLFGTSGVAQSLWEKVGETFGSMEMEFGKKPVIRTKECNMMTLTPEEVLHVFPFLDHNSMDSIHINCPPDTTTNLNGIENLSQWKNLKNAMVDRPPIQNLVESVSHFEKFMGKTDTIIEEDVRHLKDKFLRSSSFKICHIDFQHLENVGSSFVLQNGEKKKEWFFKSPIAGEVLSIRLNGQSLIFEKKNVKGVPNVIDYVE